MLCHLNHSATHFCSAYFGDRVYLFFFFFTQASLDHNPSFNGMKGVCHCAQPLVKMGISQIFFAQAVLKS
jgi:hypothetical protein